MLLADLEHILRRKGLLFQKWLVVKITFFVGILVKQKTKLKQKFYIVQTRYVSTREFYYFLNCYFVV